MDDIEAIPEAEWTPIPYWMEGAADVAETTYPFFQSEADHRRHAEIENAIGDLKYGVGLNHLPSGPFPANAAGLAVQVMAQNLARWTTRIGLGEPVATAKTPRRRFFSLAGRITRKARRLTLHLPHQARPRVPPAAICALISTIAGGCGRSKSPSRHRNMQRRPRAIGIDSINALRYFPSASVSCLTTLAPCHRWIQVDG